MIIVTGGAGFVGSNLVKRLNERGCYDVLIVDNIGTTEKFKNMLPLRYSDYLHKERFLQQVTDGEWNYRPIEAVFHIGACSDTMEYNGNYMLDNNYEYSKILLHWAMERKIPFIYASSASVYGNGAQGFREDPACEDTLNVYAFSKLTFDRYVRQAARQSESQVVGLRYFNVYGPQEHHKGRMASIVYQLYRQWRENDGVVRLFGGDGEYEAGEQRRDFIYVRDVADVNLFFLDHPEVSGVFNCGTGAARTFNDVAKAILATMGRGKLEYIDFPANLKGKYQNYTQADLTELRRAGYQQPFTSLEEAVREYVQLLENHNGYLA